jgi:hypothetical protein
MSNALCFLTISLNRNDAVVYCFEITNKGDTYLNNVKVRDEELNFSNDSTIRILAPGQTTILSVWMTIDANLLNHATVTANPSTSSGADMVGYEDVTDVDPSEVIVLSYQAEIDVQNTGNLHATPVVCLVLTTLSSVPWA